MTRTASLSLCLLLAALLSGSTGCSSTKPPRLSVTSAAITDESPDGLVITFDIAAANPNLAQIPLRDISYSLFLDGKRVFEGSRSPEATLARLAIQELRLPAAIPIDAEHPRPTGTVPYRLEGTLTYIPPGKLMEVLYDSGIPRPTTSLVHEGVVDVGTPGQ
jgi:hypothetical protein